MKNCIFCKIVNKEIPCAKVYEDNDFLAFLDIQPVADGHILIIPKEHIVWMEESEDKTISEIFKLTKKLMLALKKSTSCDYVEEFVSGTDIPHFHIHLIPRYSGDGLISYSRNKYKEKESQEIIEKIIAALARPQI